MSRLAVLAIALLLTTAPLARAQTAPKITSLGRSTLEVKAEEGEDTAIAYLSVLNAGDSAAKITVTFQASSSDKVRVDNYSDTAKPGATRVMVAFGGLEKLEGDPVAGQVVVTGGVAPIARSVSITPAPQPFAPWPTVLFLLFAIGSIVLIGAVRRLARRRGTLSNLGGPAPGPGWTFDSWATTLTAAGAVFGTTLGAVTLPEVPREIDKDTLVQLNVLFGVLLAVGPFLAQAIRKPKPSEEELASGLWGYSSILLVSYAITGGAVMGEIGALALLGWELTGAGLWGILVVASAIAGIGLAAYYFVVTAYEQVSTDWKQKAEDAKKAASEPTHVVVEEQPVHVTGEPVQVTESTDADALESVEIPAFAAAAGRPRLMARMP